MSMIGNILIDNRNIEIHFRGGKVYSKVCNTKSGECNQTTLVDYGKNNKKLKCFQEGI